MSLDPGIVFCPNMDCPARGRTGEGNISIHSRKQRRYKCCVCAKTFSQTKGTPFYRLHKAHELVTVVVTLLAHGCPLQAIVVAFGLDERTVDNWQRRAGEHCRAVHKDLVTKPRDLGQVQMDEIRVKQQGRVAWMAMAIMVSTRLWLGGVVGQHRDLTLIRGLIEKVYLCASALATGILFCTDGLSTYVSAILDVFRHRVPTGKRGRPQVQAWNNNIFIGQAVKQYCKGHVVGLVRRIVQGTSCQVYALIKCTQGGGVINTAFIERLNATFRACLATLVRRGRSLSREIGTLETGMYLVGTVYNFCTEHRSLRLAGVIGGHKWLERTPAMAAGITDHCWEVRELLLFRIPPPRWRPRKSRGRISRDTKFLIARWCQ
jgi:transposase-like protein